jgi:hypothetical protein
MLRRPAGILLVGAAIAAGAGGATAPAATPPPALTFTVGATPAFNITDVVWTGTRFLYVENTTNRVFTAGIDGQVTGLFATMPRVVEETRCVVSPSSYGFPKGGLFCHSPDNRIYRIAPDGSTTLFATIPDPAGSDGALAVDRVGRFGHLLVAASGRSGDDGGSVYTIDRNGTVRKVGSYPGPGGAENVVIAPATFGSQAGSALLTLDKDSTRGSVVAMSPDGTATTIARLPDGANPIAIVPARLRSTGQPPAGFYVVDTGLQQVLVASAQQLAGDAGAAIVGTEVRGTFWLLRPKGSRFAVTQLQTNLTASSYDLEGATFVH